MLNVFSSLPRLKFSARNFVDKNICVLALRTDLTINFHKYSIVSNLILG